MTAPRELVKQPTIRATAWTKEQIQEAARGGENEESQQENVPNPVSMIPPVRPIARSSTSAKHNAPKTRDVVQERESVATVSSSNRASPPTASQQGRKDAKKQAA